VTRAGTLRMLHAPDFRRLWGSHTVSLLGDQIRTLALPLAAVLVLHAGPGQMGLLTAAGTQPALLFSLLAGAASDRYGRRRRTMVLADLLRAALLATVPVAAVFGTLSLTQLYLVAFGTGTLSVLFDVADASMFVAVVPRERFVAANSLIHGSRAASYLAGPSLGGLLVQAVGAPLALLADAVSFLASAVLLRGIRASEPPTERTGLAGLVGGLSYLRRSATIRATLAGTAVMNLFNFAFAALFTLYATTALGISPGTLGLVLGAGAIGSLLGAFLTPRLGRLIGIGPAALIGMVLFPAPLILVPLADRPGPTALLLVFGSEFGAGLGVMMLDIAFGSITAAIVPARLRARVSGAFQSVNYGVRPIGSLLGGALGAALGLRPALWIATVGALAGVLFVLPSPVRRIRVLPDEPEEQPSGVPASAEAAA
jgi:MFS family permease